MTTAPSGQVTLVFTDLQGSTELWEKLGDAFRPVLEAHHRIVRERIAARGGFEVKTEGDSFMVAFARPGDAFRFALDVQEALHAHPWPPETGELLVRMGIHTGEPLCITDSATGRADYYGPAVNRAARIAAAGHGGQVLASGAAWEMAAETRDGLVARDLGEHRLKGLERAERIWQVLPASLAARTFQPLKTLSARPTNLPAPATSFVGRDRELRELSAIFDEPATRLVTLTGTGGTGKTRLALRLGADLLDRFEGGVWFADLSDARTAATAAAAVARALGVPVSNRESPEERVAAALEYRRPLVVILDNFEQVVEAASATVGRWLRAAPLVRFLVTSRSLLGVEGEREFEVPPLGLPTSSGASGATARVEAYDAVRLFLERAREADPRFRADAAMFPAIAELCAKLDGIPLAIELAAARMKVLKPAEMLGRLDQRFQVLRSTRRDLPQRQQTLLGAVDWSYDLLAEWERLAFRQLCVFQGGFFLEDAEAVLALPADAPDALTAVQTLREKSFLRAAESPFGTRFGIYLTLREYGLSKQQEDAAALARRHAARIVEACGKAWLHYECGPWVEDLDRLDLDRGNLRAAHAWALTAREAELACRAATCLATVALVRGGESDIGALLEAAIALPAPRGAAWWLEARMRLANTIQYATDCGPALAIALEIERAANDAGLPSMAARAVSFRHRVDDSPAAREAAPREMEVAAKALLEAGDIFSAVLARVVTAGDLVTKDPRKSLTLFAEAEELAACSPSPFAVLPVLLRRVKALDELGRLEEGLADLARAEALLRTLGERTALASCLESRGRLLGFRGDGAGCSRCLAEAEAIYRETGAKILLANALSNQAGLHIARHEFDLAILRLDEADLLARAGGREGTVAHLLNLRGVIHSRRREFPAAEARFGEAAEIGRRTGSRSTLAQTLAFVADLRIERQQWKEALPALDEAIAIYDQLDARRKVVPGRIARGLVLLELGRAAEAVREEEGALKELEATEQAETELAIRARIYLGRACAAVGNKTRAKELLRQTRQQSESVTLPAVKEALQPLLERLEKDSAG